MVSPRRSARCAAVPAGGCRVGLLPACLLSFRAACLVSCQTMASGPSALAGLPLCIVKPRPLPLTCTLCFAGSPALPQAQHQAHVQALPLPNQRPQANHQRHRSSGRLSNTSTVRTCNAKTPKTTVPGFATRHPTPHRPACRRPVASHTSAFSSPSPHLFPHIISPARWGQGCLGPCPCRSLRMPRCAPASVSPRPYNT